MLHKRRVFRMPNAISMKALEWLQESKDQAPQISAEFYCETRDLFQARLDRMTKLLLQDNTIREGDAYVISAIAGEIGNNSFDHNLGNWPDVIGIFFGYDFSSDHKTIVLADRGQGVLHTLQQVQSDLANDSDALRVAFTKKISGRAPENRGNGLKFVRQNVQDSKMHLSFISGEAQAKINEVMEVQKASQALRGCLAILEF